MALQKMEMINTNKTIKTIIIVAKTYLKKSLIKSMMVILRRTTDCGDMNRFRSMKSSIGRT